jgi:hypothetical protein
MEQLEFETWIRMQERPSSTVAEIQREIQIAAQLAQTGMRLMRSGKKPGTSEDAFKIVTASRLTMEEVKAWITEARLFPERAAKAEKLLNARGKPRFDDRGGSR